MGKGRKLFKIQLFDIFMGVVTQAFFFFPWIQAGEERWNTFSYMIWVLKTGDYVEMYKTTFLEGIPELSGSIQTLAFWFWLAIIALIVIQIISLSHVLLSLLGHHFRILRVIAWMAVIVILGVISSVGMESYTLEAGMIESIVPNAVYVYLLLFIVMEGAWLLLGRMIEEWDEASRRAKQEKVRKKKYKKERKKRLNFPGKYSKLYYEVLWKDFKYRWRDFFFLLLAGFLSVLFLFTGIGMRDIFANSYGDDQGLLGLGLVEIMRDFLVVIVLVSLFLISLALLFYRKRRMLNTGVFQTLGIRSDAFFAFWIGELTGCLVASMAGGLIVGSLGLFLLRSVLEAVFPQLGQLGIPGMASYIWTIIAMVVICLFAFGFSHDMQMTEASTDGRERAARSEQMPGRYRKLGVGIGCALAIYCVYRFNQRRTAESILVLGVFLVCLYVIVYNAWGIFLDFRRKKTATYLRTLPQIHIIRHRYQTTVRYVSLLAVIHICVLFFFTMKLVSNQIATNPQELFPYDYVFLANSEDDTYFDEMRQECEGEIVTFPMVRATTVDNTEQMDPPHKIIAQQGQNIGISETTYRNLKQLVGEKPKDDLGLDEAGKKIYIVYQQDQASKVKPLDWYMGTKLPYLHIGQPLTSYDAPRYREFYPQRIIAGEEAGSLIGCFKQGKYENLVVLSDAYFEQEKDGWKTTDMYTGEMLKESETTSGESVHEGPTRLTLVNVPKEYRKKADMIMAQFRENHDYDESLDPLADSAYSKSEAVRRRQMEHLLEITVNGFVIVMLLIISVLLLHMKVIMEMPEMQKRYQFMECFGMRERERIRAEKKEISRFVWMSLGLAAPMVLAFTAIVFYLRKFQIADMVQYGIYAGAVCLIHVLVQALSMKYLQHMAARKVGENVEK